VEAKVGAWLRVVVAAACSMTSCFVCTVHIAAGTIENVDGCTCSGAAWFMVLCDVISAVTELMVIGLQCCGMVYGVV
jgi:hypothetical protein